MRPPSKLGGRTPAEIAGQRGWGHVPNPDANPSDIKHQTPNIKAEDSPSAWIHQGEHVIPMICSSPNPVPFIRPSLAGSDSPENSRNPRGAHQSQQRFYTHPHTITSTKNITPMVFRQLGRFTVPRMPDTQYFKGDVMGEDRVLEQAILSLSGTPFQSSAAALSRNVESYRPLSDDEAAVRTGTFAFGAVTISTVCSDGHEITSVEPTRWTTFLPVHGSLVTRVNGLIVSADSATVIQLAPGKRTTSLQPTDGRVFMGIGLSVAFRWASRRIAARHSRALRFDLHSQRAAGALRGYLDLVVREWADEAGLMSRARMRLASEALILDLVEAIWEADLPHDDAPNAAKAEALVRWAEAALHARSDEPLRLADLAREAGVAMRTLQQAFRLQRGASPREVLSRFRLDRVRDRLLHPVDGTTVTDAALASGFSHLGRFAHAYRMRYGEAPSTTLARALLR